MMTKILVALDSSKRASGVLVAARQLAVKFKAELFPLRALVIPPEFPAAALGTQIDPLPAHSIELAKQELSSLVRAFPECAEPLVRVGQPWRVILDVSAELDVDLIVIGSHGYGGWDRVLGTTAAKVANMAQCNVLVVHDHPRRAA